MPTDTPDLGRLSLREHDVAYLVQRLARVFTRRPVISAWGLQYRLCEVGPAKLDPRLLAAALRRLSASHGAPTRLAPGLFSDPTHEPDDVETLAQEAITASEIVSNTIGTFDVDQLASAFQPSARRRSTRGVLKRPLAKPVDDSYPIDRRLVGQSQIRTQSVVLDLTTRPPIRVWISDDLSWLYPDNAQLWHLLTARVTIGVPLLIIARKIAPITFHLLKAAHVRGVQFYSLLSEDDPPPKATAAADSLGLPHLLSLGAVRQHPVAAQIDANVATLRATSSVRLSATVQKAFEMAQERGFGLVRPPLTADVLDWSQSVEFDWPSAWLQTLYAWTHSASLPITEIERSPSNLPVESLPSPTDLGGSDFAESAFDPPDNAPTDAFDREDYAPTRVSRGRVAASVDRQTWDRVRSHLAAKDGKEFTPSSSPAPRSRKDKLDRAGS